MSKKIILSIDPGNEYTAYTLIYDDYTIIEKGKIENEYMLEIIEKFGMEVNKIVIEMIACYGMAVGRTVFETCVWIGRFKQHAINKCININKSDIEYMYRKDVKINLCNSTKAKDSNVSRALIDRFAKHSFKTGKGTKKDPDWFYGFAKDIWAAYAVGVTYLDNNKGKVKK